MNFRTITALLPKRAIKSLNNRYFIIHLRTFFFVILVVLAGVMLQILVLLNQRYIDAKKVFEAKRSEFVYWEAVVAQYPAIPDVLYNASVSALKAGLKDEALRLLDRAITIDPLFKKALELKKEILKK